MILQYDLYKKNNIFMDASFEKIVNNAVTQL